MNIKSQVEFDNTLNWDEGWFIAQTTGTDDSGDYRIERNDEVGVFADDGEAWGYVIRRAVWEDSNHHMSALRFIKEHNDTEWNRLVDHAGFMGIPNLHEWLI